MMNFMKTTRFMADFVPEIRLFAALAVAVQIGACSKDPAVGMDSGIDGDRMRFRIEIPGVGVRAAASRAADTNDGAALRCEVLQLTDDASSEQLYLHAIASDGRSEADAGECGAAPVTRGVPVSGMDAYGSFGVFGYAYQASAGWSESLTPWMGMSDTQITEVSSGSGVWISAKDYYWPGSSRKMKFFAYAPYGDGNIVLPAASAAGTPSLTYTVPTDVAQQKDILVGCSDELSGDGSQKALISFKHALTAVRFAVGDDMMAGTVSKITLKGVYGKGICSLGDCSWSGQNTASTYTQTLSVTVNGAADKGSDITSAAQTFFAVPQTLPSGAGLEIAFTDQLTNTSRTLKADLSGQTWNAGETVTYRVSTNSIVITPTFTVSAPAAIPYSGGSQSYTVTSSASISRPGDPTKTQAMAWTAAFYNYNETTGDYDTTPSAKPDWVTAFTASGTGATSAQTFTATAIAQTASADDSHTENLQKAVVRGSEAAPYDLSMYTVDNQSQSGMTTANCYVVSAPGWYKLPLVYGNAVKGGQINTESYNPTGTSGANFLKPFVKHDNAAITAPCLADNSGVVPASAALLWNDTGVASFLTVQSDLSTANATVGGSSKSLQYLVFNVPKETICQGNAVIAVKNSAGTILWSWHIWVTDENVAATVPVSNFMNETSRMMPVNLGHCDGLTATYPERKVKVVFTQTDSGATQSFVLTQSAGSVSSGGNSPYFQWGRKDAFLPSNGKGNTDKAYYGTKWTFSSASATIGLNIQNPTIHYNVSSKPSTSTAYNLWSAKNTKVNVNYNVADEAVVKTVYDPCPPGFHVAPTNAFTGFSTTGTNTSTRSQFNVSKDWDNSNPGWYFYTHKTNKTATIFFPASGCRNYSSGVLSNVGSYGYSWAAVPYSATYGRGLGFRSGGVYPLSNNSRSNGFPVRPAQE